MQPSFREAATGRYLSDPRQADYVKGGWNYTGDAYLQDADGYFFYQSRTDDMIVSAGYNIAAAEVEDVLLRHEALAECAVIGVADEERGQIVKACVVLRPGHEGGEAQGRQGVPGAAARAEGAAAGPQGLLAARHLRWKRRQAVNASPVVAISRLRA